MKNLLFVILMMGPTALSAQTDGGLRFLSLGTDPMQLASAETMTAAARGASTLFANPALMSFEDTPSISVSNTFWIGGAYNRTAAWVAPLRFGSVGLGVLSSSISDIEARQGPGPSDGSFSVTYLAFTGGYAAQVGPLSLGVNASLLSEQLFDRSAGGYSLGAGAALQLADNRIRIGSTVAHLGKMDPLAIEASPLPSVWRTGISADILQFSVNGSSEIPIVINASSDAHVPFDGDAYVSSAVTVTVSDVLAFHGGVRTGETRRPFGAGLSVIVQNIRFGYALVPFDSGFGLTHTVGLQFGI
jgi:hypothetical protein